MVDISRSVLRLLYRIRWQIIVEVLGFAAVLQSRTDILTFGVHGGVNLMGNVPIALVFRESDVMSSRAHPYFVTLPCERSFPDAEVVAAGDHGDGFGLLVAEILGTVEKIQRAHWHLQVVLVLVSFENRLDDR